MTLFSDRIVVAPTDLSEFSVSAIKAAVELASGREWIRVVHVMPIIEPLLIEGVWTTEDEAGRLLQFQKNVQEFLELNQFSDLLFEIRAGNPGVEITNFASEIHAALIVIPSHGSGMLERLLLGSTTDRVVHLAHCPVLVLRQ
ncbi:MAG: universal stress protein [Planctomycetaceae bacterium]|nr:universal stress protein [Planctomycetaceae bacterium]